MSSLKVLVALTLVVTTVLLCSQAAPVTEFFGPPQTIEGDSDVINPNRDQQPKVEEMERFHRTYENGTVEFKMALSNGHVQYQRISKKCIDGDNIQVFEGYISEKYADGRYGTRYYVSDENGYRSSAVIIENQPPKLPGSGPHSLSWPREIQDELSLLNEEDTETKLKTLEDNIVKIESDIEDDQLSNLNLGSSISNEKSIEEILEEALKADILDRIYTEEPLINVNSDEDLAQVSELPSSTENNFSEEPTSSTASELVESSSVDGAGVFSTEQSLNEAGINNDKFEESSGLPILDTNQPIDEKLSERSSRPLIASDILSEGLEDVPEATTTGTLTNDEGTLTEKSAISLNNEAEESALEIDEARTDIYTTTVSGESSSIAITEESSTEKLLNEPSTDNANLEESSGLPIVDTKYPVEGELSGRSLDTLTSSDSLSESLENFPEATTGTFLKDEVTLTEKTVIFSNDAEESSTGVPVSGLTLENTDSKSTTDSLNSSEGAITEQPPLENFLDRSTLDIEPETESDIDLLTSSLASEIENKNSEIDIEGSTEIPLEDSTNVDNEVSTEVPNESEGVKEGRSFDLLNAFTLSENNLTNIHNETGSEDEKTIADTTISSQTDDEITNKIEEITELPESTSNTPSSELKDSDITTEEEEILSSTELNGLEVSSSERSEEINSQNSTEQSLISKSSEEDSSEEIKDKLTEHNENTQVPEGSSEEKDITTEAEALSTTEKTEAKENGLEIDFNTPVIHF